MPDADGLLWRARFDEERFSCVLYAPPCHPDHLVPSPLSERLDRGHGLSRLRSILMRYNVEVA